MVSEETGLTSPVVMFYFQVLQMVSGETGLTSPSVVMFYFQVLMVSGETGLTYPPVVMFYFQVLMVSGETGLTSPVVMFYFPAVADVQWGDWSDFSTCSSSCGGGTRERSRVCQSPDGICDGEDTESLGCGRWECMGKRRTFLLKL